MAQSLHVGLQGPCTNLPFRYRQAIYFELEGKPNCQFPEIGKHHVQILPTIQGG